MIIWYLPFWFLLGRVSSKRLESDAEILQQLNSGTQAGVQGQLLILEPGNMVPGK